MSVAQDKIDSQEGIKFALKILATVLKVIDLPVISKDIKTELFIYTNDHTAHRTAAKFGCADISDPKSTYNKDQPLRILLSENKSKDGMEFIGSTVNKDEAESNYIYVAYMDGKPEMAPLREITLALMHLLKCLVDNNIDLINVHTADSDFSDQVQLSMVILIANMTLFS